MGNLIQYPETESADFVPAEEPIDAEPIGTEYRDAVACLQGIIELSPRTSHRLMKKIVGVYRNLATIADGESARSYREMGPRLEGFTDLPPILRDPFQEIPAGLAMRD